MTIVITSQAAMKRIAELPRIAERDRWAEIFDELTQQIEDDPEVAVGKTLSTYGGSGSPNDIVLHKNGKPLVDEDDEFDALREKLFELCTEFRPGMRRRRLCFPRVEFPSKDCCRCL